MYARLLAIACLLSCSVLIGRAEALSTRGTTVGVFLKADANASSLSLEAMRLELRDLMTPTGISLSWTNAQNPSRADRLIVVTLRGNCLAGSGSSKAFKDKTPLASTAVTDGKVLPFSWVDCNALNQFLKQELANRSADERSEIFGRAMARLLAHEFYHVLTQTEAHTSTGISKASFSTADLLANYFTFEPEAIAHLQIEPATSTLAALEHTDEVRSYEYIPSLEPTEVALSGR
jgi:hypothetical protein